MKNFKMIFPFKSKNHLLKRITLFIFLFFLMADTSSAASFSNRLAGKILLQVEGAGQAWYVVPGNMGRAYLGRPEDAFRIMRELGLGVSEGNYNAWKGYAPKNLSGRILLRVHASGEAYYVNPDDLRLYYLGRPADAFRAMRELGLGISNSDLSQIPVYEKYGEEKLILEKAFQDEIKGSLLYSPRAMQSFAQWLLPLKSKESALDSDALKKLETLRNNSSVLDSDFSLKYVYLKPCENNSPGNIDLSKFKYSEFAFNYLDKRFEYKINLFEDFHRFFDELKSYDCYGGDIERYFKNSYNEALLDNIFNDFVALKNKGYTNNEIVEIAVLFAQSIEYGSDALGNRYPYETLYEAKGNCLDKSLILAGILGRLGYSAYIVTSDDHAVVGLVCEQGNVKYNNREICLIETTDFKPIASAAIKLEIKDYLSTASGPLVYSEAHYGPSLESVINEEYDKIDNFEKLSVSLKAELDAKQKTIYETQSLMCATDCVSCTFNPDGGYSMQSNGPTCADARTYNTYLDTYQPLISEFNNLASEYNNIFQNDYYMAYYRIEREYFNNVEVVKRN